MKNPTKIRALSVVFGFLLATFGLSGAALAQHAGGGRGGGGHVGGAWGHGGFGGRGGYGWGGRYGYYGGWGWGGLGLGLYFASLPLYYSTLWWEGVPYYYADNAYYRWNGGVGQYETVRPPSQVQSQAAGQSAPVSELIAYPKNGQTSEQQATDKYECHKWAVAQTGFDPVQMGTIPVGAVQGETAAGVAPGRRSDYLRAQAACLDGRGYSVK